jgi:hypothetical protein
MTGARPRVVREQIDPRLTASLFANYRSAIDAIMELVDNAVDARISGCPLQVDLAIRPGNIELTAVGGTGMGPRQLERDYLRWGASAKRAGDRLGRYGQGGKAAIGHLGNRFRIVASPSGDERAYAFEDPTYRDRSRLRSYPLRELTKPVDTSLGYMHLAIGEVDRKVDPIRVRLRLSEVYRPLILSGEVALRVNRTPAEPLPWDLEEQTRISVRAAGRLVHGWWGILPVALPAIAPGIRLYHLGRLIGEPVWFGHQGPAWHPALARLVGEVELPHVPVTMNKSDVDRDSREWLEVEARLHRLLLPVVRRLAREEGPAASPQALKVADQVRRILARALRLLESGQLFESPTAVGPAVEGPGGQLALASAGGASTSGSASEEPGAADPEPTQGADAAVGPARARAVRSDGDGVQKGIRRGFGDVVVRALDPRVRSAMVEEEGVRRVVINSQYPLYELRKGDLWYQLETALREVCVTIPEATVPEFERKVNELMLVSLSLTERRRRRRGQARPARGIWAGR